MRKGFGICCIVLGICCLLSSVGFIAYNHWEEKYAQNASESILQAVHESISDNTQEELPLEEIPQDAFMDAPVDVSTNIPMDAPTNVPMAVPTNIPTSAPTSIPTSIPTDAPTNAPMDIPVDIPRDIPPEMPTMKVSGYDCIGVLSIPVLDLELPVLTDWSYPKLRVAPCHYFGSYYEKNFVISAHNYQSHFGRLSKLQAKDLILFTDVSGKVRYYEVVLLETLPPHATEEMITSGFDLSLYTCTPGGANRVTVRCSAVK